MLFTKQNLMPYVFTDNHNNTMNTWRLTGQGLDHPLKVDVKGQ